MILNKKFFKLIFGVVAMVLVISGCDKPSRPALGDYPKDANPPGGPLKFFAALDGSSVDSIRANFGSDNKVTYTTGVSGKAAQFAASPDNGNIVYSGANDFGLSTSFSVSLWINAGTIDKKDHVNADCIMAFASSSNFWGNLTLFVDHESSTADSMLLQVVFNNGGGNSNFNTYNNDKRIPGMYDGNFHQIALTYDSTSTTYTLYIDGSQFDQKVIAPVKFENSSALILGNFEQSANIQGKSSDNTWQSSFPGSLDQVRLYGVTLSASDINTLYTNKQ